MDGFVLAGGRSLRMGLDKRFLPFHGRSLVAQAGTILEGAGCQVRILGSLPPEQEVEIPKDCLRWPWIADLETGLGPLGGILTGLRQTGGRACFLPCDMPLVPPQFFELLLGRMSGGVIVPRDRAGRLHPLCGVFSPSVLETLGMFLSAGGRAVEDFLLRLGPECEVVEAAELGLPDEVFCNLNDEEDYRLAERLGNI